MTRLAVPALAGLAFSVVAVAQAADVPKVGPDGRPQVVVGAPAALSLEPKAFELKGPRARQQLILTGDYGSTPTCPVRMRTASSASRAM